MVNVGIKSRPGISSSIKFTIPPTKPFLKPNIFQKIKADTGAQRISRNSPIKGIPKVAKPKKSISRQAARDGRGLG
jgi:hypothetical protein